MKAFFSAVLICSSLALAAQPQIKFKENKLKFEEVKAGPTLSFDFFYTNKGDKPLIINNVTVSCTCTQAKFLQEPVPPGGEGVIHVTFDTNGKTGWQYRKLEVISNSKTSPDTIQFIGKVTAE